MLVPKYIRKKRVLSAVNALRAEDRTLRSEPIKQLPKGDQMIAWACPLARALNEGNMRDTVDVIGSTYRTNRLPVPLPTVLSQFVRDFDEGKYPELVA